MAKQQGKGAPTQKTIRVTSTCAKYLNVTKAALQSAGIQLQAEIVKRPSKNHTQHLTGPKLTPQEINVLQTISDKGSIAETAAALDISPKTVQTHLAHIRLKVNLATTTQAVAWAWRRGLIE